MALGLVLLPVLVLAGFRTRTYFRETEQLRVPPRTGAFVRSPLGEFRYQIWGDKDIATPLGQGEELAKLLPHASVTVIPSVNHFPHLEAQHSVVAALRPFLLAPQGSVENE